MRFTKLTESFYDPKSKYNMLYFDHLLTFPKLLSKVIYGCIERGGVWNLINKHDHMVPLIFQYSVYVSHEQKLVMCIKRNNFNCKKSELDTININTTIITDYFTIIKEIRSISIDLIDEKIYSVLEHKKRVKIYLENQTKISNDCINDCLYQVCSSV